MVRCLTFLLALAQAAHVQAQDLPPDLARVPGHAIGFAHLQVGDALKTPSGKSYLDLLKRAGPAAMEVMQERIVPSLLSIERVTLIVVPGEHGNPEFAVLLATNQGFDAQKVSNGLEKKGDGAAAWYFDAKSQLAMQVFDGKTLMIGTPGSVAALANGPKVATGMADALALAASGKKSLVVGLNASLIPPQALDNVPPQVQPYVAILKAKSVHLSLDFSSNPELDLQARYADAEAGAEAEKAIEQAKVLGRNMLGQGRDFLKKKLFQGDGPVSILQGEAVAEIIGSVAALGLIERGKELLDELPFKREKEIVRLKTKIPEEVTSLGFSGGPVMVALLVPAVQKVREAASRMQDMNNFKQIALAMHNYADVYQSFPAAAICDKQGRPLLSWRVAILPYLEQQALYQQFKLDEPWDSEHNKKLLPRMPEIYKVPGANENPTETHYQVVVGPEKGALTTIFAGYKKGCRFAEITDGTSNTLLATLGAKAVPWTKPEDLKYDPNGELPRFYVRSGTGTHAALADGSVRFISAAINEMVMRALLTRSGGEVVQID